MLTPDPRLAALRAAAEKATPGPWKGSPAGVITDYGDGGYWAICLPVRPPIGAPEHPGNMEFIAAANPGAVVALLNEHGRLLDALAAAEGERQEAIALATVESIRREEAIEERDALAARLAGAEAVIAAARDVTEAWPLGGAFCENGSTLSRLHYAVDTYDRASEAGGEGRGT